MPDLQPVYERSHALVMGVDTYQNFPARPGAVQGAGALANFLADRLGFETTLLAEADVTPEAVSGWLAALRETAGPDDRVIVYFAGQAMTRTDAIGERGFLALPGSAPGLWPSGLPLDDILKAMAAIPAKHQLIILDCRIGGLEVRSLSGPPQSLQDCIWQPVRYAICAGGKDARGALSMEFTDHLLAWLRGREGDQTDGVWRASELGVYLERAAIGDRRRVRGPQHGYLPGSGDGDFVFQSDTGSPITPEVAALLAEADIAARLRGVAGLARLTESGDPALARTARLEMARIGKEDPDELVRGMSLRELDRVEGRQPAEQPAAGIIVPRPPGRATQHAPADPLRAAPPDPLRAASAAEHAPGPLAQTSSPLKSLWVTLGAVTLIGLCCSMLCIGVIALGLGEESPTRTPASAGRGPTPTPVAIEVTPTDIPIPTLAQPFEQTGSIADTTGDWIAFAAAFDGGSTSIYAIRADGTGMVRLTAPEASLQDADPDWSPDRSRIAYSSGTSDWSQSDIRIVSVADGSTVKLTDDPANRNEFPYWSPDGERIAFAAGLGTRVYSVINADPGAAGSGSGPTSSADFPGWGFGLSPGPLARPGSGAAGDGKLLVFSDSTPAGPEIFTKDVKTGSRTQLTHNNVKDYSPSWSPDGSLIAFESDWNGVSQIFVMGPDGANPTALTPTNCMAGEPAWSPGPLARPGSGEAGDGARIAYVASCGADMKEDIYLMNADGSEQTNITNRPGEYRTLRWAP